ncbi:MAG: DeoR/GlpR family DNA-binding transcription regulator [Pseudomonadota bacterium]
MSNNFRQPEIIEILRREGKATVEMLANHFGVTVQTIRRDLTDLAQSGKVDRVHGGAIIPSGVANINYYERQDLNAHSKAAIAAACAAQIPSGASVFLNIGTSTEAVAHALAEHEDLMVFTNNLNIAKILAGNPQFEVVVTGGTLRKSDGGLVGAMSMAAIEQFRFDIAVVGCSAIDADGDLLDYDIQEVGVSKAVLKRARRSFLVADSSKFQRTAPVRIASLFDLDMFFTDAPLSGSPLAQAAAQSGTDIVCAG